MSPSRWIASFALLAAATIARADYQVTLSNVHLCCKGCIRDAKETADSVPGASIDANKDARTISITASNRATAQKAVDALVDAGFFGTASDPAIHVTAPSGDDKTVTNLTVSGVHLCCKGCVSDLNKAVGKVKGVTGTTAEKDADSFQISGTFNEQEVIKALHAAGFAAQIDKS
ncbi:MAG TPA: heavy-metal-associated domain-containing protein [Opitutaceae bacterium]|jgi:copper chaperone CopZ|nr:heavy-metal-associated domain-containing protein [Opitutaceae bacterium]